MEFARISVQIFNVQLGQNAIQKLVFVNIQQIALQMCNVKYVALMVIVAGWKVQEAVLLTMIVHPQFVIPMENAMEAMEETGEEILRLQLTAIIKEQLVLA
jgi:hypothetical protein